VIEPDRHPAWGEEDGHAIAHDERSRVVHLEPLSPMQFHGELAERLPLTETIANVGELLSRHRQSPRETPGR
jgi:hypothetical protein